MQSPPLTLAAEAAQKIETGFADGPPTVRGTAPRRAPVLAPEDSLVRASALMRSAGVDALPVISHDGIAIGCLSVQQVRDALSAGDADDALAQPVGQVMSQAARVPLSEFSEDLVVNLLGRSCQPVAVLETDDDAQFLGYFTALDIVQPLFHAPRLGTVGGMATPWGVYLTNGSVQAGASDLALAGSGAVLGVTLAAAHQAIGMAALGLQNLTGRPFFSLWDAVGPPSGGEGLLLWFALQGASFFSFLVVLRMLPLAGYHAAEHQAVHALERGEPLRPQVLARMPRVHPRCGTNLIAAITVFAVVSEALPAMWPRVLGGADAALIGALAAMLTWRPFGAMLQERFTTRPATLKQLASGIQAAEELACKAAITPLRRPPLWKRLWYMGMPQTMLGVSLGSAATFYLCDLIRYLTIGAAR